VLVGGHGIEILESGGGDVTAAVSHANSSGNESFGVSAAGSGTVTLDNVTFSGAPNLQGNIDGSIIVVLP
jgi:hypothetical protein